MMTAAWSRFAALDWAGQRERSADAVATAAGLAYGWYIMGAVADGRPFIGRALAMKGDSSAEQRAMAGAWGAWLTQIGSGAATSEAGSHCSNAIEP
jgi:hypothetical protein